MFFFFYPRTFCFSNNVLISEKQLLSLYIYQHTHTSSYSSVSLSPPSPLLSFYMYMFIISDTSTTFKARFRCENLFIFYFFFPFLFFIIFDEVFLLIRINQQRTARSDFTPSFPLPSPLPIQSHSLIFKQKNYKENG